VARVSTTLCARVHMIVKARLPLLYYLAKCETWFSQDTLVL